MMSRLAPEAAVEAAYGVIETLKRSPRWRVWSSLDMIGNMGSGENRTRALPPSWPRPRSGYIHRVLTRCRLLVVCRNGVSHRRRCAYDRACPEPSPRSLGFRV
jgi:hypothetical protein